MATQGRAGGRTGALLNARLVLAIGDPTGIGPEVLARALADAPAAAPHSDVLLVGDAAVWKDAQRIARVDLPAVPADRPGPMTRNGIPFLDLSPADRSWSIGEMSPAAGRAAAQWLERAARMALEGSAEAVVFAPLNKQAMIRAGYPIRDEYDLCARLARVEDHDEMNVIPHPANPHNLLWVARATGHAALREVPALLTLERVLRTIRLAHRVVIGAGADAPRIGVAALNPHAGEGGFLGDEEARVITPAIEAAKQEG
ncbi:MAG: 4-hydroxythreonine-4-phosphate dehydrogenase PdxA, partial [bacterium]